MFGAVNIGRLAVLGWNARAYDQIDTSRPRTPEASTQCRLASEHSLSNRILKRTTYRAAVFQPLVLPPLSPGAAQLGQQSESQSWLSIRDGSPQNSPRTRSMSPVWRASPTCSTILITDNKALHTRGKACSYPSLSTHPIPGDFNLLDPGYPP